MLTQQEYLVLQQRIRRIEIKIELLNNNDAVIDTLEGVAVSGGINMQADSTFRRSGNLVFAMTNKDLIPKPSSRIWFNRKVKISIGLKNWSDETIWFDQGIFIIQDATVSTSLNENTIELNLTDLMGNLDGSLNGNLSHEVEILPEGTKISDALRTVLSSLGKVSVDDITIHDADALIPFTINVDPNSTVYDLVETLLDLYMGMEIFFDKNGYLIIQRIKDKRSDAVAWDLTTDGIDLTIDSTSKTDFANVRNSVFVWGRKKDNGETVKWTYKNRFSRDTITQMNAISNKEIGDICHVLKEGKSYVWKDNKWMALEFIVPVEFNIENIGEKTFAFNDTNIVDSDQAMLRAEYELVNRGNLSESIDFSCVPIYGLSVNSKVKMADGDYIVKSVTVPLDYSSPMQVSVEKLYY